MNRHQRREAMRGWRQEQGIRGLLKRSDPTRPLVFTPAPEYEHAGCGGSVERPNNPVGWNCLKCDRLISHDEVRHA